MSTEYTKARKLGEKEYKKEVEFFTWEKLDAKDLCREICGME